MTLARGEREQCDDAFKNSSNQDGIDVAWTMRCYLARRDRTTYEHDVHAWKGKDRTLSNCMNKPQHLLLSHKQDRVLTGRCTG